MKIRINRFKWSDRRFASHILIPKGHPRRACEIMLHSFSSRRFPPKHPPGRRRGFGRLVDLVLRTQHRTVLSVLQIDLSQFMVIQISRF
ncbi:hypothetical protein K439DRAFT_278288 [Ramaria rubella]|nr:hypothetical protein K439DRAFT_278288 [Ramaria rubella]